LGEEIFGTGVVAGFEELVALCFEFLGHGLCVSEALGFCDLFPKCGAVHHIKSGVIGVIGVDIILVHES
jgi:hypothetical protein